MDSFITIRFKRKTAKRFQEFSRTHFKSHTDAMATMLAFFFYNEISPKENFGPTGRTIAVSLNTVETNLLKRLNAIIAIQRDIEKTQTKPALAMLESLFQTEEPKDKTLILEKKFIEEKKTVRFEEKRNTTNEL
ncbi:BfmA/BtgA family mobilization protein [Gelidibacter salicanalis]|uniref:Golgi family protein P55 n=1 Tax=Gelidibacter salicanalis TaxID=291193 RepID=A0A934NHC7_9FLAO|nr:BfmA/BtgA family mobilization protein [Gelidibacter salicanalis]MBJ7880696.1 hypothetical protein [Gelidibacter salicanalis]